VKDKFEIEPVTEDWARDYEKIILSKKYDDACSSLADFFANPTMEYLKNAFAAVSDVVMQIPLDPRDREIREKWIRKLNEIEQIIYGNRKHPKTQALFKKYNIVIRYERQGINLVPILDNIVNLGNVLRKILLEVGDVSYISGLRLLLPRRRKYGLEKILEEEGFVSD